MDKPTVHCPECDTEMVFEERSSLIKYNHLQEEVLLNAYWCNNCGESVLGGEDLRKSQKFYMYLKAKAEKALADKDEE